MKERVRDNLYATLATLAKLGVSIKLREFRNRSTGLKHQYFECNTARLKNVDGVRGRDWKRKVLEKHYKLNSWFNGGADVEHFISRRRVFISADGGSDYTISAANALGRRPEDVTQAQRAFFKSILFGHAYGSIWRCGDWKQQVRRIHRQGSEFENVTVHEIASEVV